MMSKSLLVFFSCFLLSYCNRSHLCPPSKCVPLHPCPSNTKNTELSNSVANILKEKEFRESVKEHQWDQYLNQYVAITCSSDAIIPSWAYLLISTALAPFAKKFVVGDLDLLENMIFQEVIFSIPLEQFTDVPVVIKGCSNKQIPDTAYALMCQRLVPVVSSLMFGEACSSVPLFKKKK